MPIQRRLVMAFFMLLCCRAWADEGSAWVERYTQAMNAQDSAALAELIADQATVVVTLTLGPQEAPMVVTLTRAEYLQQQKALWRFAAGQTIAISDVRQTVSDEGLRVSLHQRETYQLFQQAFHQESDIVLTLQRFQGRYQVAHIRTRSRQW